VNAPVLGGVHQREPAAADPRALRLHHVQGEGGRHGRIHRIPASPHHGSARLGGERMGRGDGAAGRDGGKREQEREHPHGGAL